MKIYIIILFNLFFNVAQGIDTVSDTSLIKVFSGAFTILISQDETMIVVLTRDHFIDIFEIEGLNRINGAKVSRNAWLDRAYFSEDKSVLYYDYGTSGKIKYMKLTIKTRENIKIKCYDTPKGCSYESNKTCLYANPILSLTTRPILFKSNGQNIEMYRINK